MLAVWFWTDVKLGIDSPGWWRFVERWGLNSSIFDEWRVYKLVSYGFVHGGFWHLLTNLIMLPVVGQRVAGLVGNRPLLILALSALLSGGGCQLLMNQFGSDLLLIGASPIGFAWALAWMGLDPDAKTFGIRFRRLGPAIIGACALLSLVTVMPQFQVPEFQSIGITSHASHFGGAIVGWLWAAWWMRRKPVSLESLREQRAKREG